MADISTIHLNGVDYTIKDAEARSLISGLGNVMNFKGSKLTEAEIKAITSAKIGDVWLNSADGSEWVCTQNISVATASAWEKLGYTLDISTKADKVTSAVAGDLAGLDINGNLVDSGKSVVTTLGNDNTTVPTSKAVADALEDLGGGDMLKSTYDPNETVKNAGGIVAYVEAEVGDLGELATKDDVTSTNTTVNSITDVGTLPTHAADTFTKPTFTQGSFTTGTLPSHTADAFTQGDFSQGVFSQGSLPTWSATVTSEVLTFSFDAGSLPSHASDTFTKPTFTPGVFDAGTLPSHGSDTFTQGDFSQGAFSAGTLPTKGSDTTVVTSIAVV